MGSSAVWRRPPATGCGQAAVARDLLDLLDDANKDPQRKEKIRDKLAKLDGSLPEWVKRDWRWAGIAESCRFRTR